MGDGFNKTLEIDQKDCWLANLRKRIGDIGKPEHMDF